MELREKYLSIYSNENYRLHVPTPQRAHARQPTVLRPAAATAVFSRLVAMAWHWIWAPPRAGDAPNDWHFLKDDVDGLSAPRPVEGGVRDSAVPCQVGLPREQVPACGGPVGALLRSRDCASGEARRCDGDRDGAGRVTAT
jgi:hypothetical protein